MQAVIHSLHSLLDSFLHSPYRPLFYAVIAAAAVLLVSIPLIRALSRRSGKQADDLSLNSASPSASPSMLGLTSPAPASPAPSRSVSSDVRPAVLEFNTPTVSKVRAINDSLTVPCIHCGGNISTRQDFCPACGYAQPVKQSFKAAFPA